MQHHLGILASLPRPARYLPWMHQRDLLAPGLFRSGHDFGNGIADQHTFQFDSLFPAYHSNMLANRRHLQRYYCRKDFPAETETAVNQFIIDTLLAEQAGLFEKHQQALHCALTGEHIDLSGNNTDLFDALASQLQEDIAVLQFDEQGNNHVAALHLNCPNHWGANQRIGENFFTLHQPVPGLNNSLRDANKLLRGIMTNGHYVRFVWGLVPDTRLNLHPDGVADRQLKACERLFVRIERQTLIGLAEVNALLFLIRTSFIDSTTLREHESDALQRCIKSIKPEMLEYKGLKNCVDDVVLRLQKS